MGIANLHAQYDSCYFSFEMYKDSIEIFHNKYGKGKIIPQEYELPALLALSHYPELNELTIEFITAPLYCTMQAQPKSKTLFDAQNRTYIILINNCRENTGFIPSELSFNQLVGVFAHELAHISYYSKRTAFGLLADGLGYYFKDYRKSFEAATDMLTLEHRFGWQLLDFTDFIMNKIKLSSRYEKKKQKIYLSEKYLYQEMIKRSSFNGTGE